MLGIVEIDPGQVDPPEFGRLCPAIVWFVKALILVERLVGLLGSSVVGSKKDSVFLAGLNDTRVTSRKTSQCPTVNAMDRCSILIKRLEDITEEEYESTYKLFCLYFEDIAFKKFTDYAKEYQHLSFYYLPNSKDLVGFSSVALHHYEVHGEKIWVFSNGHTVVSPEHRDLASKCVSYALAYYMSRRWDEITEPNNVFYWMMSEGVASYLWVKNNFRTFYPRYAVPTPQREQKIINYLGALIGLEEWDESNGVCKYEAGEGSLKQNISKFNLDCPDSKFFLQKNPGHGKDYLCVLAKVDLTYFVDINVKFVNARMPAHLAKL